MEFSSSDKTALVVGAGSVGAHLSRSLAKAGWFVTVIDTSNLAIRRFSEDLYPGRYGELPLNIRACQAKELNPEQTFDALIVGTPPDTHIAVLREHTTRVKRFVSIQKPLTTYRKSEIRELEQFEKSSGVTFLAGFNHRVSLSALTFWSLIPSLFSEQRVAIEAYWLESWAGIMKAHPWLSSPGDTYLGFTSRGGGSLFEHSHGLDLALLADQVLGLGTMTKFSSEAKLITEVDMHYDQEISIMAEYSNGSTLRVRQDVVTWPAKKKLKIVSEDWTATLDVGSPERILVLSREGKIEFKATYSKSREEDFDAEARQFEMLMGGFDPNKLLSSLSHGLRTSKISSLVAHQSLGMEDDTYTKEDLIREGIFNEKIF